MFTEFKIDHKVQTNSYEPNLFILISLLHINGFINRDSLKAQFKSLKAGTLNRRVGTYHSRVNNQWYNDEKCIRCL